MLPADLFIKETFSAAIESRLHLGSWEEIKTFKASILCFVWGDRMWNVRFCILKWKVLLTGFGFKRLRVADTVCFHWEESVLPGMRSLGSFTPGDRAQNELGVWPGLKRWEAGGPSWLSLRKQGLRMECGQRCGGRSGMGTAPHHPQGVVTTACEKVYWAVLWG